MKEATITDGGGCGELFFKKHVSNEKSIYQKSEMLVLLSL